MGDAESDKDAIIEKLKETVRGLKGQVKTLKIENARLSRVNMRQAASRTGRSSVQKKKAINKESKKKVVKAPSSRLYNPQKMRQKTEQLLKKKEEEELAQCSFSPNVKAKTASGRNVNSATDRLFKLAKRQRAKRQALIEKKNELMASECTFSPNIDQKSVSIAKISSNAEETFSRLSQPRVVKINEMGLNNKDLLECTFTPKLINPQRSGKKNQVATHDRLYAEAILRQNKHEQVRKAKEEKKKEEEMDGCTFVPKIEGNPEYGLAIEKGTVVDRLYNQDVENRNKKKALLKKEVAKEHPFHPKVKKNKQYQTADGDIIERLYTVDKGNHEPELDAECTFSPAITSLASKIDRGDLPTHERLALEMSPSQKIALADMEDYYEEEEEYYDEYGEEEEYAEEYGADEGGDMEAIDEEDNDEEEEEMELP